MREITAAKRLDNVRYAIRDLAGLAEEVTRQGHKILPLTVGDPNIFDFETPAHVVDAVVKAMRAAPQPIVAAIDGVCAGAGAIIAMASDLRIGTAAAKVSFLFNRVGLAGCDMGACAILPRIIGQGRAAELLYSGRSMSSEQGLAWGFFNRIGDKPLDLAMEMARELASGPTAAHAITKKMLHEEWDVGVDQAIDMEAVAQAALMENKDFRRAYEAFAAKQKPVFEGD
jgi:enoyl-CoA hydratase/carnithine racemase